MALKWHNYFISLNENIIHTGFVYNLSEFLSNISKSSNKKMTLMSTRIQSHHCVTIFYLYLNAI